MTIKHIKDNEMKAPLHTYLSTGSIQTAKSLLKVFAILITCGALMSCFFSSNTAPTSERRQPPSTKINKHVVKPGETLFAIAWRYGVDYKALARANGIGDDFLIYAGQTLNLSVSTASKPRASKAPIRAKKNRPQKTAKKNVKKISHSKSVVSRSSVKKSTSAKKKRMRPEKKSSSSTSRKQKQAGQKKIRWRWPATGVVLTNFSQGKQANKGIDIGGKKGESVTAAAAGKVVYAGSGLRGYGKLVIIKHNDTYLSAYAHNDRLHVKEGQKVKIGQHIANIGSSGSRTDNVKLHFEIRRNGRPVNPLGLLPKRKI